jgi:hypothetical protein
MSTSKIDIKGMPNIPNFGYYTTDNSDIADNSDIINSTNYKENPHSYSNKILISNLMESCVLADPLQWSTQKGIYDSSDPKVQKYLPNGKDEPSLDIPFYLAKAGVLVKNDKDATFQTLSKQINTKCIDDTGKSQIVNQIQYLTCQLEQERNKKYSNKDFENSIATESIKSIFDKFSNIKPFLIIIFCISIYLFLNGFFGSLDFCSNLFILIESKSGGSLLYWVGILIGIFIPFAVLVGVYSAIVCKNLTDLEKLEITSDPYGIKNTIPTDLKAFDVITLILFLFLFYALVAVLFTIQRDTFGPFIYTLIVCSVLLIIAILMYILYAYVPFFNTTDIDNIGKDSESLRLFIDGQPDESDITSNQYKDANIRKTFLITFIVIYLLGIVYFKMIGNIEANNWKGGFLTGLFASCAVLVLPALWVLNFFLAINLFYVYPIIIMLFRFIRYILMSLIYVASSKSESMKDNFSDDLIEQLNDFKNYSPPWGLIGMDELKIMLNTMGYDNMFSKEIFPDEEHGANISANKFFASGLLHPLIQKMAGEENNSRGILFALISFVLTVLISAIILFGIAKINS